MKSQVLALLTLSPLVAFALPKSYSKCGKPPSVTRSTVSSASSAAAAQTSSQAPGSVTGIYSVLPSSDVSTPSAVPTETVITTSAAPTETVVTTSAIESDTAVESSTATPTSTTAETSDVATGVYSEATEVAFKVAATQQCGDNDRLILPGMPWTVANSMYNADQMVGSQCTNFNGILQAADDIKEVSWTSVTDIELVDSTKDLCKGYTNIGIGVNLNKQLSAISSIPAYFQWSRTNTTEFRGSNLFDFVTAPTSGDGTSTATSEFMLWIRIWGGQVPIGYVDGPVATFDMFGASWKLYEGKNPGSGVTVRSMLVDEDFDGVFQGDLKEWMDAMVEKGYISNSDYLTVGNAGTEVFYGNAVMDATVALNIEV
ncbi:family 12 glycoside hydrolase [Seiridium cupressi]